MKPFPTHIPEDHFETADVRSKSKSTKRSSKPQKLASAKTHPATLELYQREDCPFSHSVRVKLSELGLDYITHNIPKGDDLKHQELVKAGGKDQIPFLVDHHSGVKLYESDAILQYLEKEYGKPRENLIPRIAQRIDTLLRARAEQLAWQVRKPIERIETIRRDAQGAWSTLSGSARFVRETILNRAREGMSSSDEEEMASEDPTSTPVKHRATAAEPASRH